MKKILFLAIGLIFLLSAAFASQEGALSLDTFTIKSRGIGESGPVLITGKQNEKNEFTSLIIKAFGRKYKLSQKELRKLPKIFYNGIQLSYEKGYKELGGKTIYVIFQMGFTSGVDQKVLISLSEDGTIKIE